LFQICAHARTGEIVDSQLNDLSNWIGWKSHDAPKDGAPRGFDAQSIRETDS
jgi:hypothetical protein